MTEFDAENIDLEAIQAQVAEITAAFNNRSEELSQVKTALEEAERVVRELYTKKNELARAQETDRRSIRELEKEKARRERLVAAQERRNALLREFEERSRTLDDITADAKWREFAFEHQLSGAKRLAIAKRGILADKRGLGKTLTSLIYLDMVQSKRAIVLAPNDVVPQFEDEIRTWAPGRTIFSLRGLPKMQRDMIYPMLALVKEFIITLNYEAWRKDKTIVDDLVKAGIDTIICDEAHRIKSSTKLTARGVFQIAYRPNYCSEHGVKNYLGPWVTDKGILRDVNTRYLDTYRCDSCSQPITSTVKNVLTMTGTPILNKPQELFSMLHLVDSQRFVDEKQFLRDYCYSYAPNRWKFLSGGLDRLTKSMSEFFVQRNRDDAGIHVPPPAINIYRIDKDPTRYPKQYEAERNLRQAAALILENGEVHSMLYILEIILRERQCMTWPAGIVLKDPETKEVIANFDVEESQKLDEALDLLNDLVEEEERVIVFSKFKAPLYEAHRRLTADGVNAVMATGDQSQYMKEAIRNDFDLKTASQDNYRWQVCFATFDAFGTGINLNAARHIIMLDDEWNPGMEDQAIGRIDRLNSVDQANVHIFRVNKSIDSFMESLIEEKRQVTEGFESSLTAQDLLNHLRDNS